MELLILAISILGSTCGGFFGVIIWYKHAQKLLSSEASNVDHVLANPTIASIMIITLGASGFLLSSAVSKDFVAMTEDAGQEEFKSDRSSQPSRLNGDSSPVIDVVPIGESR